MKTIGIWLGILSGLIGSGLYLFLYYTDITSLFRWLGLIGFSLGFVFMVITAIYTKRNAPPAVTFRELIQPVFAVFAILMLCLCICHYLMFNVIDPNLPEQYRAWNLERIPAYMESIGSSAEDIEQAKADWEVAIQSGWREIVQKFFFYQIPGFFMALIITALAQLVPSRTLPSMNAKAQ